MRIEDWRPFEKGSLCGFFSLVLVSGLIIHDVALFEKNGSRWVSLPAQKFIDQSGKTGYKQILEFTDRAASDRFRQQVLEAVDRSRCRP
jgi:DNA-binding cell septation regulator SpoVG